MPPTNASTHVNEVLERSYVVRDKSLDVGLRMVAASDPGGALVLLC